MDPLMMLDIIQTMENFLFRKRPPEDIRPKLDIGYKIDKQSVFIFEIRPAYHDPEIIMEYAVAKTTFSNAKKVWKVFWLRSDNKWHKYDPMPFVEDINAWVKLVEEDKHGCFWG